jgi:hypothetical protein
MKMVLAMQQLGCGQAGAAVVGGMLSIAPNVFDGQWSPLEEEIAKLQTTFGEKIIDENVEKEKKIPKQTKRDSTYSVYPSTPDGTTVVPGSRTTQIRATTSLWETDQASSLPYTT